MRSIRYRGAYRMTLLLPAGLSAFFIASLADIYWHGRLGDGKDWAWIAIGAFYVMFLLASVCAFARSASHEVAISRSRIVVSGSRTANSIPLDASTSCNWRIGRVGELVLELSRKQERVKINLLRYAKPDRLRIVGIIRLQVPKESQHNWKQCRHELRRFWLFRRSSIRRRNASK